MHLERQNLHFASETQDNVHLSRQEAADDVFSAADDVFSAAVIINSENIKIFILAKFIFLKKKNLIQNYEHEINGLFYRRKLRNIFRKIIIYSEYFFLTMTHLLHVNDK